MTKGDVPGMSNLQRPAMLRNRAKGWTEPWKSILEWVKEGTEIPADMCMLWKDSLALDNRECRATLAGDATHAMPPGGSMGIRVLVGPDAFRLRSRS
jgi:hypothetical protein